MGATLDIVSEGRLEFGIGAGWHEKEYIAYGYPFPVPRIRIMQLKEGVTIIKKMWTDDKTNYTGKYFHVRDAICEPKPVQKPHPPIWIGGAGEKLTLRIVAELADGHNMPLGTACDSPQEYGRKMQILREHCMQVGRDFDSIRKSWLGAVIIDKDLDGLKKKIEARRPKDEAVEAWMRRRLIGTPEECVRVLQKYVDVGVELFILSFQGYAEDREIFESKVIPEFT
jgi:alkanesulfonate monooxygenase SsuD/methylene tetrahydromethanopterin reductase-like flavin-dependent oxidoreductase (luciferase family)